MGRALFPGPTTESDMQEGEVIWGLSTGGYLAGFFFVWLPLIHASPWWILAWVLPIGFGLAMALRRASVITGLIFLLFALAGLVAWGEDVFPALAGVVSALWAYDFALLWIRMARAGDLCDRRHLITGQAIRSGAIGLGGLTVALIFHLAHFFVHFWVMLGLVALVWMAVLLLLRHARRLYSPWGS